MNSPPSANAPGRSRPVPRSSAPPWPRAARRRATWPAIPWTKSARRWAWHNAEAKMQQDENNKPAPEQPPLQAEMPFAIVQGEPYTSLPRDLYIPPDALEVFLEAFEGPLDLLLYLIRRQNLDILDIPIAEITRQYVDYIELMRDLRLELAAEYLVMAAILAEIKSRLLLPRPPAEEGVEEDPRAELVRRLQEYERFKKAAEDIEELPRQERDFALVSAFVPDKAIVRLPPPVDLRELLLALKDVLKRAELMGHHAIQREALSVRNRMSDVLKAIGDGEFHRFEGLFNAEEGRLGIV